MDTSHQDPAQSVNTQINIPKESTGMTKASKHLFLPRIIVLVFIAILGILMAYGVFAYNSKEKEMGPVNIVGPDPTAVIETIQSPPSSSTPSETDIIAIGLAHKKNIEKSQYLSWEYSTPRLVGPFADDQLYMVSFPPTAFPSDAGDQVLVGLHEGEWVGAYHFEPLWCQWIQEIPTEQAGYLPGYIDMCTQTLLSQSESDTCEFTISHPEGWNTEPYFIVEDDNQCLYLTADDYQFTPPHGRDGLYMHIERTPINAITPLQSGEGTLEEQRAEIFDRFIAERESINTPRIPVGNKIEKVNGKLEGIQFDGIGFSSDRSFIFVYGDYVYEVTYPYPYSGIYENYIYSITSSITFE